MLSHMFIPLYMNIHSNNCLFLSSCIHMQYYNILKNSKKKTVIGMYIHIQSDIYPPTHPGLSPGISLYTTITVHPFWILPCILKYTTTKNVNIKKTTAFINLYTVIFLLRYYLLAYHCTLRYSYISPFLLICTNIKHLTLTKMAFINIYMVIMAPYYCHAY